MEPIKITFCGKTTSGKDTAFKLLNKHFRTCRYAFATHLKKTTAILFNLDFKYFGDDLKDTKLPDIDYTPRDLLIGIGSKAREYVPTIFADYVYSQLEREAEYNRDNYDFLTVTDARYQNEANNFKKLGFIIVKIVRDSAPKGTHISECDLDNYPVDKIITNNGTLEEFEDKILALAIELRQKRRQQLSGKPVLVEKVLSSTCEITEETEEEIDLGVAPRSIVFKNKVHQPDSKSKTKQVLGSDDKHAGVPALKKEVKSGDASETDSEEVVEIVSSSKKVVEKVKDVIAPSKTEVTTEETETIPETKTPVKPASKAEVKSASKIEIGSIKKSSKAKKFEDSSSESSEEEVSVRRKKSPRSPVKKV